MALFSPNFSHFQILAKNLGWKGHKDAEKSKMAEKNESHGISGTNFNNFPIQIAKSYEPTLTRHISETVGSWGASEPILDN